MHARYYSPLLGRFLSTDPLGGWQSTPQSFNLFSYVIGNPIKYAMTCVPTDSGERCTVTESGNPLTGVQGLNDLVGARVLLNSVGSSGPQPRMELGLLDRALSSIPIQSNDYGNCVRAHRADPAAALVALGSAVPKAVVPPFRVPTFFSPAAGAQSSRLTTPASVAAHYIRPVSPAAAGALRAAGRAVSTAATVLTLAEGTYDWGALTYCGFQ
jgi:hypothetical protein